MTRAERARIAVSLRARGWTGAEIARSMGISRSYASSLYNDPSGEADRKRKDGYRRPCPECGALMDGSEGHGQRAPQLCKECAKQDQIKNKRWDAEGVIAAIQEFARINGRPPLASEWLMPKHVRGSQYPPASAVYRYDSRNERRHRGAQRHPFASWAEAIEAAGFPRPKVGRKVRPRGGGAGHMARAYMVLRQNGNGSYDAERVEAYTPEHAIEKVAVNEGEYIAVLERYWLKRKVEPMTKFAVVK